MYTFRKKGRNREMKTGRKIFALLLVCVLCLMALPLTASASGSTGVSRMVKKTQDSVAAVCAMGYDINGTPIPESWGIGTCFAVGKAGKDTDVFLTNWHVVTPDGDFPVASVRVWILKENCQFNSYYEPDPNNSIECRVLKTTSGYPDYAILKMQKSEPGYKALPLMSAKKVEKGTQVYALGFPGVVMAASKEQFGSANLTATDGIVSQHSQLSFAGNTSALLHTATTSHGNSGGPLVTRDGAVVGINTYGFGEVSADYSCAIYIDYAMEGLDELGIPYTVYSKLWVIVASAAAGIAVIATIVVIVLAQKKKKDEDEKKRQQKAEDDRKAQIEKERREKETAEKLRIQNLLSKYKLVSADGKYYSLTYPTTVLGRDPSCQICCPADAKGISRKHCQLGFLGNELILTDVGSTYGTFIHEKRIPSNTPVKLHTGSYFCLGGPESNKFTIL